MPTPDRFAGRAAALLLAAAPFIACKDKSRAAERSSPPAPAASVAAVPRPAESPPSLPTAPAPAIGGRWCGTPEDAAKIAGAGAGKLGSCPKQVDGALRPKTGAGALELFPENATGEHEARASTQATDSAGDPRCCYDWTERARKP